MGGSSEERNGLHDMHRATTGRVKGRRTPTGAKNRSKPLRKEGGNRVGDSHR